MCYHSTASSINCGFDHVAITGRGEMPTDRAKPNDSESQFIAEKNLANEARAHIVNLW